MDIGDFLKKYEQVAADYNAPKEATPKKKKMLAAAKTFAALPAALSDCFYIQDNVITGWNTAVLTDNIALDFSDSTLTDIVAIGDNALADCAYISSLNIPDGALTSIGSASFSGCTNLQDLTFSRADFSDFYASENAFADAAARRVNINCNGDACNLSVYFSQQVPEMSFSGNGSTTLSTGVSALFVDSLSVSGFTTLAPSALVHVRSISNLVLYSPDSKVLAIDEDALTTSAMMKYNMFVTRGNKGRLSCAARSFSYIGYSDIPTFDLENVQLDRNAFLDSEGTTIKFTNWDKGTVITTAVGGKSMYELTAFAEGSLMDAAFSKIYFPDLEDMEDISKTLIVGTNKNVLSCRDRSVLRS